MTAYYNEIDPYAAQWLRNLIAAGHIAPGEVDERSIADVSPDDLAGYDQCHFFAGIGGWSLAARLAGWPDDRPLWTGSCPCQPFSVAGKQAGFDDVRHLWPIFRDLIAKRYPAAVFGEQVASASDWLGLVRSDLEALGYAVGAIPVEAASAGAYHKRDRFWFMADASSNGWEQGKRASKTMGYGNKPTSESGANIVAYASRERRRQVGLQNSRHLAENGDRQRDRLSDGGTSLGDANDTRREEFRSSRVGEGESRTEQAGISSAGASCGSYWRDCEITAGRRVKSGVRLLAHGIPARVAKLRAFGNAIVPALAAEIIGAYMDVQP